MSKHSPRKRTAPVVAIDGPAGAGKSTVSRLVAKRLGYLLLDTGALYRCVGLSAERHGAMGDPEKVSAVARDIAAQQAIRFEPQPDDSQRVLLGGEDVTDAIRTPEVSTLASKVSAIPGVRAALLDIQRDVGRAGKVVVEGRDIGSVVFPDAEAKFFLTASVETRAERRHAELQARQADVSLKQVEAEVRERDQRDSSRPVAPLVRAQDAELVDSTGLSIEQVVEQIASRVEQIAAELKRDDG